MPLPLIMAGIGAGTNLLSGWMGSRAASRGAAAQTAAGYDAGSYVWNATNPANQGISEAGHNAGVGVESAAEGGAQGVLNASQVAANGMTTAVTGANAGMQQVLEQDGTALNPYINSGHKSLNTLDMVLGPDGRYTSMMDEKFKFDPASDPSFQFTFDQGMKAIQKSAAARGGLQGGGTMQSLAKFGYGLASQEYAKQHDRFQQDRNNRFNILTGMSNQLNNVAGMGLDAATIKGRNQMAGTQWMGDNLMDGAQYSGNVGMQGEQVAAGLRTDAARYSGDRQFESAVQTGRNLINAATYQGDARMGVGNAQAAGHIGAANAWGSGLTGAANAGMNGYAMGSILRPRSTPESGPTASWATWKPTPIDYRLDRR